MFRVDRRLVLTLGFLYMVSLIDRTNLGAAAIAGYVSDFSQFKLYLMMPQDDNELNMNAKNNAYTSSPWSSSFLTLFSNLLQP